MGSLPDDDVSSATPPLDGDADDTTTAEAGPPAAYLRHSRPPPLPSARSVPAQPPSILASSMPARTVNGPIASAVPVAVATESKLGELELEDDEPESITTMARRASGLAIPGIIAIRNDEDDALDDTEVRTLPGNLRLEIPVVRRRDPRPAAGVPSPSPEAERDEHDRVTTEAQAPAFLAALTAAATAGPSSGSKTVGDATLDDLTEGTTKKLRQPRKKAQLLSVDSESESITTKASAPLSNILRVSASDHGTESGVATLEDDELPENRTAVMANAPLQRSVGARTVSSNGATASLPPVRPTAPGTTIPHGSLAAARATTPQLTPSSESGLRLARSPEQASLGALGEADPRPSAISQGLPQRAHPRPYVGTKASFPAQPSAHHDDLGKGPRYGLVVAIVAVVSFIVPVTLFVVLRGRPEELVVVAPAEAATELQGRDPTPRIKVNRKAFAAVAATSASASAAAATASASANARKPPHHR